ncbi:MAG: hypothetical protein ACLPVI_05875 [Dehalococcoidales bacterium]
MSTKIGEIVESNSTEFTAECYELHALPSFGSLVKVKAPTGEIFGIVCQSGTASIEPGRHPVARGKDETSEEAVYQASPQLMKLLRSEFQVLVVGHSTDGKIYRYLPSKPAHIHAFVQVCSPAEIRQFSQSFDFLSILVNNRLQIPTEELVAAALREMSKAQTDPQAFLVAGGKALTVILNGEYHRLKTILARLKQ